MGSGFRGGLSVVLMMLVGGSAVAGPPRIEEESSWWRPLNPTTWSVPKVSLPKWPRASQAKSSPRRSSGTGVWDTVTRPARSAWSSTKRVFTPAKSSPGTTSGGFWSNFWTPAPPERSIDTVGDFLAQPAPYY